MNNLIEAIKEKQRQNKLSDGALALILGIDRSTWAYIKSGKRKPGMKFLAAVANQFPALKYLVDVEFYDKDTCTTHHRRHHSKILRAIRYIKGYRCLRYWFRWVRNKEVSNENL